MLLSDGGLPLPDLLSSLGLLFAAFWIYYTAWIIYSRFFHPYHDIPGPFLASITQWWYFRSIRYGIGENTQLPLHKKYGKFVRTAPNEVQIMDAKAIDVIYGVKPLFLKTEFYDSFEAGIGNSVEPFSVRDEKVHDLVTKKIGPFFTIGAVLEYEPFVDRIIELFCKCMGEFASSGQTIDFAIWSRKFTFDVVGGLFFGEEDGFGFLRDDKDVNGWMEMLDSMVPIISSLGYIPYGMKIPYLMSHLVLFANVRKGIASAERVKQDAKAAVRERQEQRKSTENKSQDDMLSKLMNLAEDPAARLDFNYDDAATVVSAMFWAGSDTTGYSITSIMYLLLKHPAVYTKLVAEIRDAFASGSLSYPVKYADANKLPYLKACIMESFRYSPVTGTGFPRYVPKGGATISDRYFPEGYKVIINPNAVHFDKNCFGEDAEEFVPERWMRYDEKTTRYMSRHEITFGFGKRRCGGEKLSLVEIYKFFPTILNKFDFELVKPEWKVRNGWFRRPSDVMVRVTVR